MLNNAVSIAIAAILAGSIVSGASAQDCERFLWFCTGPSRGPAPEAAPVRPSQPVQPYGQPVQPYGQPVQPYGQPVQPYGQPVQPGQPMELPGASMQQPDQPGEPPGTGVERQYALLYGPVGGERFPVPALKLSDVHPAFLRTPVIYPTGEAPGTVIVDPRNHYLYFVLGGGRAMRYGVGVGRSGFGWSGVATIHEKQQWPDWYPPKEMLERQPDLKKTMSELQGGLGMPGGPRNPLGARALYLWQGNKDTLFRIHGTVEPWTIGKSVSSGCIRMLNHDVIDLFERAPVGAKVVVL